MVEREHACKRDGIDGAFHVAVLSRQIFRQAPTGVTDIMTTARGEAFGGGEYRLCGHGMIGVIVGVAASIELGNMQRKRWG